MAQRGSFFAYLKSAFTWHWNLLALGAGVAVSIISGLPDVILPLVAAAEIAYLGLLSTHPKFRKSIDARKYNVESAAKRSNQLEQVLKTLSPKDVKRYRQLRQRCLTMNRLARQFRGLEASGDNRLDNLHESSMDRLLWMFLKLLYSKDALVHFLNSTNRNELVREITETKGDLEKARQDERPTPLLRSLEDKLKTMQNRLQNYDAASDNHDLINVELERIEQKITAVSEMALSSNDPAMLSTQVDGITESISVTTEAIKNLNVVPEIQYDDEVPELLRMDET